MNAHMIFRTAAATMIALALTVAAPLYAQPGHGGEKGGKKGHGEMLAKKLNLTEQQKAQIKTLRDNFKKEHETELSELKSLRSQMKDAKGNQQTTAELRAKMQTAKEALKTDKEKLHQQIAALLTADQQQQMEQLKADRKERHEQKKERKMGRQKGVTGEGKSIN